MTLKRLNKKNHIVRSVLGTVLFLITGLLLVQAHAVANTLQGQVTTAYGQTPASDISVKAIDIGSGTIHYRTTDSSGNYSFDLLPDGTYMVMYTHPSGKEFYLPGTTDSAGANTYAMTGNNALSVNFDLYNQLPELAMWPGSNSVGTANVVGNPTALSFIFDNAVVSLSELDVSTFKITFDGLDITSFFLQLPAENYLVNGNKLTINLHDIELPPGLHTVAMELGNKNQTVTTFSRQISVQSSKGFQIGFHMPPVEDWVDPFNDWAVDLNRANETFERHHSLVGYFTSWKDANGAYVEFNTFLNDQISGVGAVPVITWEPWKSGGGSQQSEFSMDAIVQKTHDAFIQQFASAVLAYGKPVILRLMHEFNGVYYPWAGYNNNNDPTKFIAAFQHIVNIFKSVGATNAQFMWSPNYAADSRVPSPSNNIEAYYPGDDYVDWIGVSGYNWGSNKLMQAQGWLTFDEIFNGSIFGSFLSTMASAHPGKKVIIAEIGCNNDATYSKANWITNAFGSMPAYSNFGGAVWFNNTAVHDAAGLTADFRVINNSGDADTPDPAVTDAYKNAVK